MTYKITMGHVEGCPNLPYVVWVLSEKTRAILARRAERNAIAVGMTREEWRLQRLKGISLASADFEMAYNPTEEIRRIRRLNAGKAE